MTAYTPGPWDFEKSGHLSDDGFEINSVGCPEKRLHWKAIGRAFPNNLGAGYVSPEEAEANARLMAAAPELLAVCQSVLRQIRAAGPFFEDRQAVPMACAIEALKVAISKATGESPTSV